jgi:hypothetical protein
MKPYGRDIMWKILSSSEHSVTFLSFAGRTQKKRQKKKTA